MKTLFLISLGNSFFWCAVLAFFGVGSSWIIPVFIGLNTVTLAVLCFNYQAHKSGKIERYFVNQTPDEESLLLSNETVIDSMGWVQLAPFGDWPNNGGMQRFEAKDAANIVADFNRLLNTPQRMLGLPWYIGHPDHPAFKQDYQDKKAYGRIKQLESRADGLYANVKFNESGKALVNEQAFSGHSVNWKVVKEGGVYRPISLKSVGFTNEPNIPVKPVLQANEKQQDPIMEKKKLCNLLGLGEDSTEDQIANCISDMKTKMTEMKPKMEANEKLIQETAAKLATAETTLANEKKLSGEQTAKVATLEKTNGELTASKSATETALANEKKLRATERVATLIVAGKVTKAEEASVITEFVNEFAAAEIKYAAMKSKLHTQASMTNLGARNARYRMSPESRTKQDQIMQMVNEEMAKSIYRHMTDGDKYTKAYTRVQSEHPDLFANG